LKNKLLLVYFFFLCTVSLLTKQLSSSRWSTWDDPTMQAFIDGSYTGAHESIMVFEHPLLGVFLSKIYQIAPVVPWYPVFLTTMIALALSIVIILCSSPMSRIFSITLAVFVMIRWTQNPSFSISAVVVIACALWIGAKSIEIKDRGLFFTSSVLLAIGVIIRSEAFFLALLIVSPIFIWIVIFPKGSSRQKVLIKCGLALALFFSLQVIVNQSKFFCISDTDCASWNTYSEYNQIRGDFQGSSRYNYLGDELESVNWSQNDYALFYEFNNPDTKVFDLESLTKADSATKEVRPLMDFLEEPFASFRLAFDSLQGSSIAVLKGIFACFLAMLITVLYRKKYLISMLLITVPLSYWIAISIAAGVRLPERILIPATYAFALTVLWFFDQIFREEIPVLGKHAVIRKRSNVSVKIVLGTFVIGMFTATFNSQYDFFYLKKLNAKYNSTSEAAFVILNSASQEKPIVASGSSARILLADPWVTSQSNFENQILFLGWNTFSPYFYERKSNLDIDNLFLEIANGSVRYYGCPDYQDSDQVAIYLKEHYGISGKFKVYKQPTKTCAIYDFLAS
jgi:hypothetical protein